MQQAEQAADAHMSMGKMEAPCLPLRTALHSSEKGTKEQIEEAQDEERHYTRACINANKRQLSMGRNETIAGAKYSLRLVKEVSKALGNHWLAMYSRTASVCTQLDQQQTFLSSTHTRMARRRFTIRQYERLCQGGRAGGCSSRCRWWQDRQTECASCAQHRRRSRCAKGTCDVDSDSTQSSPSRRRQF